MMLFRRRLFWRVYVTLLAGLVAVALFSSFLWHRMVEGGLPPGLAVAGHVLEAAVPPEGSDPRETAATLARISAPLHGTLVLEDASGALAAAARQGKVLAPPEDEAARSDLVSRIARDRPPPLFGHATLELPLTDGSGRRLLVEAEPFSPGGPSRGLTFLLSVAAAVGIAAYPVVARLTRRLETLRQGVEAWGGGALSARITLGGSDEVAAVAASFNRAAERVSSLLAAHKSLLAHASHELRSPLTRLRMGLELMKVAPDESLQDALTTDIDELDGLVEEILLASRLDHGSREAELETVDCLALAAEEAARTGAGVIAADTRPGAFELRGSRNLLRRLIRNLLENAARHGHPPVQITLDRAQRDTRSWIAILVEDHGPGIPESETDRIFEPFYRPAGRSEAAGSWGLGLALVRQIAARHAGTVACRNRREGGAQFMVELPVEMVL